MTIFWTLCFSIKLEDGSEWPSAEPAERPRCGVWRVEVNNADRCAFLNCEPVFFSCEDYPDSPGVALLVSNENGDLLGTLPITNPHKLDKTIKLDPEAVRVSFTKAAAFADRGIRSVDVGIRSGMKEVEAIKRWKAGESDIPAAALPRRRGKEIPPPQPGEL